jgi:hypothetical protein
MFGTKAEVIQDTKTGETITRHKVPPKECSKIDEVIQKQEQLNNNFVLASQQQINALSHQLKIRLDIDEGQKRLMSLLQSTCKKMGLPKDDWIYNIKDKSMELRKAPSVSFVEVSDKSTPDIKGNING